ncbi:hypothetical protein C8Q74DRAFT_509800 [Fomes fomentarius]|nr:hypothetical protein C8Q74DRAFT_509800 [Fomes fomentarius]
MFLYVLPRPFTPISDVVCLQMMVACMYTAALIRRVLKDLTRKAAAHKRIRSGTSSGSAPPLIPILHIAYPNRPQARRTSASQSSNFALSGAISTMRPSSFVRRL